MAPIWVDVRTVIKSWTIQLVITSECNRVAVCMHVLFSGLAITVLKIEHSNLSKDVPCL